MIQWRHLRLPIWALLTLSACSFDAPTNAIVNLCSSEADCPMGSCTEGRCVADGFEPAQLVFQVVPLEASDIRPSYTTPAVAVTGPHEHNIDVPGWVEVRGQVRYNGERVGAEIEFSRDGLAGRPRVVISATTLNEPDVDEEGLEADYIVRLEAGRVYDVTVRPTGTLNDAEQPWFRALPPLYIADQLETPEPIDGIQNTVWRAMFPYEASLNERCSAGRISGCTLSGRVVRMHESVPEPEEGLQVRAVDERGRVVSSVSLTDAEGGFSLVVSPSAETYVLRVGGGSDRPLFPVIEADPARLNDDLRIQVPDVPTIRYEGTVETDAGSNAAATLAFESSDVIGDDAGLSGAFRTTASADGGRFSVDLLPGTYEVTITPSDLDLAVSTETVRISTGSELLRGQIFRVTRRSRLGGTVDVMGVQELEGATVEARSVERGAPSRSSAAVTDETGRFALPLDVGTYDLFLRPPPQSGFGWVVVPDLVVGSVDTTLAARYTVEAPVPVSGLVRGIHDTGVDGVEVRAFARSGERFVEVGRSRVQEDGHYEMLIPPAFMN